MARKSTLALGGRHNDDDKKKKLGHAIVPTKQTVMVGAHFAPEVQRALRIALKSGMRIALATSSDEADIAIYKKIVDMDDLVEESASSDDAKESKPNPDIFAAALKKMGIRSDQAIALGDTPYDASAAGQLGIPVIGLTCGGWKRDDLSDAGCMEVYQDPADLLLHFDSSAFVK